MKSLILLCLVALLVRTQAANVEDVVHVPDSKTPRLSRKILMASGPLSDPDKPSATLAVLGSGDKAIAVGLKPATPSTGSPQTVARRLLQAAGAGTPGWAHAQFDHGKNQDDTSDTVNQLDAEDQIRAAQNAHNGAASTPEWANAQFDHGKNQDDTSDTVNQLDAEDQIRAAQNPKYAHASLPDFATPGLVMGKNQDESSAINAQADTQDQINNVVRPGPK